MGMFSSFKKTLQLRRLSKILGKQLDVNEFLKSMEPDNEYKQAEKELYELIETDQNLKLVIQKYGASRDDLKMIYNTLIVSGAGLWTNDGNYVAVSAMAFVAPLDYLLKNKNKFRASDEDRKRICYRIIEYFDNGEIGHIYD